MTSDTAAEKIRLTRGILKRLVQVSVSTVVQAAILFIASGRFDWVMAWVYVGVIVGVPILNSYFILPKNPDLIAERGRFKDAKRWDRVLMLLMAPLPFITLIIAGLDVRFEWSPQIALAFQSLALVLVVLGYGLVSWAMISNKFFSGVVRIQRDRGHIVVTAGPYRYIRHPGYVGMIIASLSTPILLGSLWALIPAGLNACAFILRTALEDKTLQDELDGYKDYAQRVRYRLAHGIW